jgi:hypothetical protein
MKNWKTFFPKTSFSWSSLQIQLQMGCEKGEIQSSMNFFLLNYWFLVLASCFCFFLIVIWSTLCT